MEHDLFRKPVSTFRDHAQESMIFSENRFSPSDQVQGHAFPDHALADGSSEGIIVGARSWLISRMIAIHFSTWASACRSGDSLRVDPGIGGMALELVSDMASIIASKDDLFPPVKRHQARFCDWQG
jgi:hypothetical protein